MKYNALTISRYIIYYSDQSNYNIPTLKLQPLLYLIQSAFLIKKADLCFKDEIEAWNFGPVVKEVYKKYKKFGIGNIPVSYVTEDIKNDYIEESDKEIINKVIDDMANYSPNTLMTIICNQKPYLESYRENHNNVIEIDLLKEYFK